MNVFSCGISTTVVVRNTVLNQLKYALTFQSTLSSGARFAKFGCRPSSGHPPPPHLFPSPWSLALPLEPGELGTCVGMEEASEGRWEGQGKAYIIFIEFCNVGLLTRLKVFSWKSSALDGASFGTFSSKINLVEGSLANQPIV